MELIDLSIIIISYNTSALLRECLNSIFKTIKDIAFEVFVVDNNSSDDSVEMIKNNFPSIKLIENKKNEGFPNANNHAIGLAKGEHVLFINPDTIVLPQAINRMVNCLKLNEYVGAVGPMILDRDNQIIPTCGRNFPTIMSVFWRVAGLEALLPKSKIFGRYYMTYWDHMSTCNVECLTGACMMVRKNILDKCKGFVEIMYAEDIDLCYRIGRDGWNIRYLPESKIIHYAKQSSKKVSNFWAVAADERGLIWFFRKHRGITSSVIVKSIFLTHHIIRLLMWKMMPSFSGAEQKKEMARIKKDRIRMHKEVFKQLLINKEAHLSN